ncbi:translocation/assembly module TamB domain-containing protein [Gallaecimonas sp. GXIMD1310]|uniref:autotransporter assembly complex protein TamB n=1 Tax=Gallaecimonas sp. GXIMD1310 TaxID=3131926 RepID=UPI003248788A
MRWLKRASWLLLITLSLLLVAVVVLSSTAFGNRWLWAGATKIVPGLSGQLQVNSAGRSWTITSLRYGKLLQVHAMTLRWQPAALLESKLVISHLAVEGVKLAVPASPANQHPPQAVGQVKLPLAIDLQDLSVNNAHLQLPGVTISWQQLAMAGAWDGAGVQLDGPDVHGLVVTPNPPEHGKASAKTPAKAISLPPVTLPMPVKLAGVLLRSPQLAGQHFNSISMNVSGQGQQLQIGDLTVVHRQGKVKAHGTLTLAGDYPLALTISASTSVGQLAGQQLTLKLSQSLAKLAVQGQLSGPLSGQLSGTVQPLQSNLPVNIKVVLTQLAHSGMKLTDITLTVAGNLDAWQLNAEAGTSLPAQPVSTLYLAARGDRYQAELDKLTLVQPQGQASLAGKVAWKQGLAGKLALTLKHFTVAQGVLSGSVKGSAEGDAQHWQFRASPDLQGLWAGKKLALTGQAAGSETQTRLDLRLAAGPNQITAQGQVGAQWQLQGTLDAPALAQALPEASGAISGQWALTGPRLQPQLTASLKSADSQYQDIALKDLQLSLAGQLQDGLPAGELTLQAAKIAKGDQALADVTVKANGNARQHQLQISTAEATDAIQLALQGELHGQQWQGKLTKAALRFNDQGWQLQAPVSLRADKQNLALTQQCWQHQQASICLAAMQLNRQQGQFSATLSDLPTALLSPWLPGDFSWQALINGRVNGYWQQGKPVFTVALHTAAGTFNHSMAYQSLRLDGQLNERLWQGQLAFASEQLGQLHGKVQIHAPQQQRRLSGRLALQALKLDWLAPLVPSLQALSGTVSGQGKLSGTLAKPLFDGQLQLQGGQVTALSEAVAVTDMHATLNVHGQQAQLQGQAQMGGGKLTLGGQLRWARLPVSGQLTVQGQGLEAGYPGFGQLRLSPDLTLALGEQPKLTGTLNVPWARIEVESLPDSAVTLSPDVTVVDGNQASTAKAGPPLALDLRLVLGSDVRLDAFGLKSRLTGQLHAQQKPGHSLLANGQMELADGTYKAYGQNLMIRQGKLLFTGGLDNPSLNVEAIRNPDTLSNSELVVGVKVTGSAQKPQLKLFSEPAMTQAQQLSYLLRGKALDDNGQSDGNAMMKSMLVSAGVSRLGGVFTGAAEKLGVKDVSIDTSGSGSDTAVSISGYVLPGLQLEYGVGVFSSVAQLKLRYALLPKLYLEAVSGVNQAVDLFYQFSF